MEDQDHKETLALKVLQVALVHLVIQDRQVTMVGLVLREHLEIPDFRVPLDSRAVRVLLVLKEYKDQLVVQDKRDSLDQQVNK